MCDETAKDCLLSGLRVIKKKKNLEKATICWFKDAKRCKFVTKNPLSTWINFQLNFERRKESVFEKRTTTNPKEKRKKVLFFLFNDNETKILISTFKNGCVRCQKKVNINTSAFDCYTWTPQLVNKILSFIEEEKKCFSSNKTC